MVAESSDDELLMDETESAPVVPHTAARAALPAHIELSDDDDDE